MGFAGDKMFHFGEMAVSLLLPALDMLEDLGEKYRRRDALASSQSVSLEE